MMNIWLIYERWGLAMTWSKEATSRGFTQDEMKQIITHFIWFSYDGFMTAWWFQTCFIVHFIYGMSSFPLTNSYFSRWLKHVKTTKQFKFGCICGIDSPCFLGTDPHLNPSPKGWILWSGDTVTKAPKETAEEAAPEGGRMVCEIPWQVADFRSRWHHDSVWTWGEHGGTSPIFELDLSYKI